MSTANSFYWFDYETFGTSPIWDRPCQFAGVRTDLDLNETDDPMILYCRQSEDYLPHPAACQVTGLSPQQVNAKGLSETRFIERIVKQIGYPGTCSLGYNSISFDDEFTRHTLFRNFLDPYEHEYKEGNSRWDLLDIVRLTRALRPEGINWPLNEQGGPSNRLEHLSAANGIAHDDAHDALSDVRATIGMARLIRKVQPRLFAYAFEHRSRQAVAQQLRTTDPEVCLLVSGTIPASRSHIAAILPLALHPSNRNSVIVIDLHQDPSALLDMSAEDIAEQLYARQSDPSSSNPSGSVTATPPLDTETATHQVATARPGLRTVQINKCPVLVPMKTLRPADAERLQIDLHELQEHERCARKLLETPMREKIVTAMTRPWPQRSDDVDGSLYSGAFLSPADRRRATELRQCAPEAIENVSAHFEDRRLIELALRYQARNFPESLDSEQRERWQQHCHRHLHEQSAPWLSFAEFDQAYATLQWHESQADLQQQLLDYRQTVEAFCSESVEKNHGT